MGGKKQKTIEDFAEPPTGAGARRKTSMAAAEGGSSNGDRTMAANGDGTNQQGLLTILQELRDFRKDIGQQLGALSVHMDLFQTQMGKMTDRVKETENRISTLEDAIAPLAPEIQANKTEIRKLMEKCDELEGRSRRANVRLLGVPESAVKGRMEDFVEALIPKILPDAKLSGHFIIERAHRLAGGRSIPGAPPRAIIFKLLNYRDRDEILRAARVQKEVKWENNALSLYPDLTPNVQQARKKFDTVKAELRKRGITYAMLHPAKLRFVKDGTTHFYTDPKDAWSLLERTSRAGQAEEN